MIDMQGGMELALGNGAKPYQFRISIIPPAELSAGVSGFDYSKINTLCKSTVIPGCRITQRPFYTSGGHIVNIPNAKVYDTEWNATFYLDDFYYVRILIEKWMALIDYYNGQNYKEIKAQGSLVSTVVNNALDLASGMLDDMSNMGRGSGADEMVRGFGERGNAVLGDFSKDVMDYKKGNGIPMNANQYTGNIVITQMSTTGSDIISYKLNNAYPIMMNQILFDDTRIDSINEFMCSFGYSDYEILEPVENMFTMAKSAIGL